MVDQVTRVQALSGGPFTANNNRMDFDIPDTGVYDLSQSWVNIYVDVETTETGGLEGVHNVLLSKTDIPNGNNIDGSLYNVSLIQNAYMRAARVGSLEDIREVGTLRQNLLDYMLSTSEKDGLRFLSNRQPADRTQYQMGPLRELHKQGAVTSRNVRAAIPVPLSDIFELGTLDEYHTEKWGKTRVHLEAFISRITAFEAAFWQDEDDQKAMNDITALGDVTTFTTTATYTRLEDLPFWVGQKVKCSGVGTGSAVTFIDIDRLITEITWNTDNSVTLTVNQSVGTLGAGETYEQVDVVPTAAASLTVTVPQAELVLQRVRNPGPAPDRLDYRTWTTEQFSGNNETNFQRIFQCEPNAVNLFMMFPVNTILSQNIDLTRYRLRIDGKDVTDRDVNVNTSIGSFQNQLDPLHYDRLSMAFINADLPLKNYNQFNLSQDPAARTLAQQIAGQLNNITMIATPLPLTSRDKNLQVNLTLGGSGLGQVTLYKQVVRSVA